MYSIVHLISAFIRQFVLPNPYLSLIKNIACADIFNILVGGTIIHIFAYTLTGCGYKKGINSPACGSAGYLISYIYLTFVITGLGYICKSLLCFILLFLIIFILSCIIVGCNSNRNKII